MGLTAYTSSSLSRDRKDTVKLLEADVYIAKGNLDGYTFPSDLAGFASSLSDPFKNIGINTKDSPDYKTEAIVEEVDYENIQQGVKVTGNVKLKLINADLVTFLSKEIRNVESTILIVPKNYSGGDVIVYINGVKLTTAIEGKTNSAETPVATLSFMKKAKYESDVIKIDKIPES